MRRKLIVAAWIAGATVPLLMATVFVFGCCVLPFHGVMHKLMPLCNLAMSVMRGDDRADPATPPVKQDPVKRIRGEAPASFRLAAIPNAQRFDPLIATGYRSFISHGAARCDRDVGLHVLVETFRI